jgi:malonate-semialdehyde dehydrogenase (acetylating)/methylmalonate-semialdehyde dehydrogenase
MYQVPHWINGKRVASSVNTLNVVNPATSQVIGTVCMGDSVIVDQAVSAAREAFISWSMITPLKRARFLGKFKLLLEQHHDELAAIVTREHGKTLDDARGSVQRGIDVVEFACGIPAYLKGSYTENVATDVDSYSLRQPLGVCVGITPFNFPAMIPLWMFPMAIACGNTFVLKPSEKDPSCAIRIAELAKEAGVPDGVINVVQGENIAVNALITHEDVKTVSFVGSTPIAEYIYKTATSFGKRVQAFAGAKNHCVVMPDADLDQAADAIVGAAYGSAGERCMAISVVVAIGDALADTLVAKIITRAKILKIGPGDKEGIEMGPLISKAHWDKVKSYIDLGIQEGAMLVVDGRDFSAQQGYFMGASLFDHVQPTMRIYQEEIFGPVLSVVRVTDFQEALKLVNTHELGNGAAIYTRDGHAARTFVTNVQAGMVGINIPIPVPVAYHSFGGWKRSMFGDITMHGAESVQFFTKLKTVTQRWLKNSKGAEFIMPTH